MTNTTDPRVVAAAKAWDKHIGGRYAPDEVDELADEVAVILAAADAVDPFRRAPNAPGRWQRARAEGWVRGFLFSYGMERGYSSVEAHSMDVPNRLMDDLVKWNPYGELTALGNSEAETPR